MLYLPCTRLLSEMAPGDFIDILQHRRPPPYSQYPYTGPTDAWQLQEAFEGKKLEEHGNIWDRAWKAKQTSWDRGGSSMALYETLNEYPELFDGRHPGLQQLKDFVGHGFGHETASGIAEKPSTKRKKALVPACGRGYDAVLLAYVFGYDVYALEISEEALVQANAYLANLKEAFSGLSQGPEDFPFWVSNRIDDPGHITYVLGDFFSDQWMKEEKIEDFGFDLIRTKFFCAIPPTVRPKWAARMQQLLARPDGRLVCLEFPTGRHLKEGGPPYSAAFWFYQLHLTHPGNEEVIKYEVEKDLKHPVTGEDLGPSQKPYYSINMDAGNPYGGGLSMLARFKPRKTHEAGQSEDGKFGRDWVSVWGPSLGRAGRADGNPKNQEGRTN